MARARAGFHLRSVVKMGLARLGIDCRRVRSAAELVPVGDMRAVLAHLAAEGLRCTCVLDVGANRGDWSRLASEVFPEARFVLLEPQVELSGYLDAFCARHPGSRWFLAAAGREPGQRTLTVWDDLAGSSLLPEPSVELAGAGRQREVPVVRIDDLLERGDLELPQLVKLDVQGAELEALAGASRLFGATEVMILETSLYRFLPGQPVLAEVVAFMAERGYAVHDLAGHARRPSDGALAQLDVCFAREGGALRRSHAW